MKNYLKPLKFKIIYALAFLTGISTYGQQPTHVPGPQTNSPIDLNNWFDVIVFIILPIGLIFLYFFWRRQVKKDREN